MGNTTSGCYGYTVEKSIAYGYLPIYLTEPGTKVDVELMGSKYKATVVPEPLVLMEAARARKVGSYESVVVVIKWTSHR